MIKIVSSRQDSQSTSDYSDNLAFLKKGLKRGKIDFQDYVKCHERTFDYREKNRICDFTRSAKADVRENMITHLCYMLPPGLQQRDRQIQKIREAFACLFEYETYKNYVKRVGQQKPEFLKMLIFNHKQKYVAHVQFSSTTVRDGADRYTVNATLTCQRFTYFPVQNPGVDFDDILLIRPMENLHVA